MDSSSSSSALARGKACMSCRRRKIRCDGGRPICGQCNRAGKAPGDCEYSDAGRTRTQILEENITHLEQRIRELENPAESTSIHLYHPYSNPSISDRHRSLEVRSHSATPQGSGSRGQTGSPEAAPIYAPEEEPPIHVVQELIDNFLAHASVVGFFLSPGRFRQSALLPLPLGHHARPAPALLSVVYLWGLRFAPSPHYFGSEAPFLARALQRTSMSLQNMHPQRILHTIQVEILLAHYFFCTDNALAGARHAGAALNLATTAGLHRIRTMDPHLPTDSLIQSASSLPPPADAVAEGERINAFWAAYALNCTWGAALGAPLGIIPSGAIDTPWPLDAGDYEHNGLSADFRSRSTVQHFLADTLRAGTAAPALVAKGAILFARATLLAAQLHAAMPLPVAPPPALTELDATIAKFIRTFPPPVDARASLLAQSLAHAATIRLHTPLASSAAALLRLRAARAIVDLAGVADIVRFAHVDAVMGSLWVLACEVFFSALRRLRSSPPPTPVEGGEEYELADYLQRAFVAMATFALDSPIISRQLEQIQGEYARL